LAGERSLLQDTVLRLAGFARSPLLVCGEEHRFIVAEQLRDLGVEDASILLEPELKNTAPAIALAALAALRDAEQGERPVLAVFPSDHAIDSTPAFGEALAEAEEAAGQGYLVALGVEPREAETGYGYIKQGKPLGIGSLHKVERFHEKPDREVAEHYLAEGGYFWNAGIFVMLAERYLEELGRARPDVLEVSRAAFEEGLIEKDFFRAGAAAYRRLEAISIDHAVMERTSAAAVRPLGAAWSDLGSWDSVWRISQRDGDGNALRGEVLAIDSANNLIQAERSLVAALGVSDLVIVESSDAFLVCPRERAQEVRRLVAELERRGSDRHQIHNKVLRPWGGFESLDTGERYQVKRLTLLPGRSISLQRHQRRAEHWVVVRGTARVTRGEETITLEENQSTFIPVGVIHRLENPGPEVLEVIEVQTGDYLREDDIERFADEYGRS
jgi:mannose-1-phosphate guanylyltransferase/mannose-6-phosphate isomerase